MNQQNRNLGEVGATATVVTRILRVSAALLVCIAFSGLEAWAQAGRAVTNEDVVKMVAAGLTEPVVMNAIRQAAKRDFDVSPMGLIDLKKNGVSDSIIAEMQKPVNPSGGSVPSEQHLTGKWSGDGSDSTGPGHFDWDLSESGNSITGSLIVNDARSRVTLNGSVVGEASGSSLTFTMTIPIPQRKCEVVMTGSADVASGQIVGTYEGTSCGRPVTNGRLTLSRPASRPELSALPGVAPPSIAPQASSPCADIDYLGVIQAVTGGGQMAGRNAYGGRVRNRASYTKEVEFAWVMNGQAETGTFRIPAGQFIDVNLGQGPAPPTNVRVVTCR